jgi:hypothetical protein
MLPIYISRNIIFSQHLLSGFDQFKHETTQCSNKPKKHTIENPNSASATRELGSQENFSPRTLQQDEKIPQAFRVPPH